MRFHIFCCDLDLDLAPMALKYEMHTKNKLSMSRLSKVYALQKPDILTDATKDITTPHSRVVIIQVWPKSIEVQQTIAMQ